MSDQPPPAGPSSSPDEPDRPSPANEPTPLVNEPDSAGSADAPPGGGVPESGVPGLPDAATPHPGQPYPGQPYPGQPYPGQPYPGQPYPGQPYPGQPYPSQVGGPLPYPGQPYPTSPYGGYPGHGLDPASPLVNPPGAGVGGWYARCVGAVRRGWPVLLPIVLITQVLPAVVVAVLGLVIDPTARWEDQLASDSAALPTGFWADAFVWVGSLFGAGLIASLAQCVGWAAGTWVIARQAAGAPVDLGTALRYGLRRALGLWGWTLLVGMIVLFGLCLCFLPGIYAVFALAMVGPVYLFERNNPIGRSHQMLRQRLGLLLGRLALVIGAVIAVSLAAAMIEQVALLSIGTGPMDTRMVTVGTVVVTVMTALLTLPAHLAQLVGLVVTYAEQRAHEGPVNDAQLAHELG
ncbi:hypothetical protein ABT008_25990 [Micromonospora sp. NPDC002389]|uniref:hypothetical protein n=1 Tax=Micromonospora sp. NPDC002389 TaxID=3154272 RepID=UPI003318EF15